MYKYKREVRCLGVHEAAYFGLLFCKSLSLGRESRMLEAGRANTKAVFCWVEVVETMFGSPGFSICGRLAI